VYKPIHPNDHVNMAQSTNDVIPTAIRLAALTQLPDLLAALDRLAQAFLAKGNVFDDILKAGRTHLQDATPIRLGQEFTAYGHTIERNRARITQAADGLRDIGIGGTAVGTGLNAEPRYPELMVKHLGAMLKTPLRVGTDRVQLMQSMGDACAFSGALRTYAVDLSKIASDIRLLASGPRTGIAEILLPAVQPGSSIMPGKVNPSIAEMVNMVCFQVIGNDTAVVWGAGAGQLELNVMMPGINFAICFSATILANAARVLRTKAIDGLRVDEERSKELMDLSPSLIVTALSPHIGYKKSAALVMRALAEKRSLMDIAKEEKIMDEAKLRQVLDPLPMTKGGVQ
jgi:aspartate ammonia-lyase